jgi:hypothetical protein
MNEQPLKQGYIPTAQEEDHLLTKCVLPSVTIMF